MHVDIYVCDDWVKLGLGNYLSEPKQLENSLEWNCGVIFCANNMWNNKRISVLEKPCFVQDNLKHALYWYIRIKHTGIEVNFQLHNNFSYIPTRSWPLCR